jgi:chemotaxis response regulator CheB
MSEEEKEVTTSLESEAVLDKRIILVGTHQGGSRQALKMISDNIVNAFKEAIVIFKDQDARRISDYRKKAKKGRSGRSY